MAEGVSRSRRKTPIICNSGARTSEKEDKRLCNRALRRKTKEAVMRGEEDVFPVPNEIVDPWSMSKDGKRFFDPKQGKKWLRK